MATIEAVTGNPAAIQGKGAQKAKGLVQGAGMNGGAGSFMTVLMQLLGQDFSAEEIGDLEALVMNGIRKGKTSETGKETSDDETGPLNFLAGLALLKMDGANKDLIGKAVVESAGLSVESSAGKKGKSGHPELKQLLKALQGGTKGSAENEAPAPAGTASSEIKSELETAGKTLEKGASGKPSPGIDVGSAVKSEKGEITIDLDVLKKLVQKESRADPSITAEKAPPPETGAALNPLRLEEALGEQLKPILAQAAAAGETDTVSVNVKDGDIEKKFTIRRSMLLARHGENGPAKNSPAEAGVRFSLPESDEKAAGPGDGAGSKSFVSEDFMQGETDGAAGAEHEKVLIKEMTKPAGQSAGKPAADPEFSNVLVKYFSKGPDGQMEKVFYQEIETPGLEKKTLLIKTETIQSGEATESGETAPASGLTAVETGRTGNLEGIESREIIRQVAEGAESALKKDYSRVRMELNPPQMGTLDMDLVVSHDRVRMIIMADSQDVRNMLQGNMDQLRSSLEQQGLKMDGVDVFVQDRHAESQGDQSGQARDGGRSYRGPYADGNGSDASPKPEIDTSKTARRPHSEGTGLSVFA